MVTEDQDKHSDIAPTIRNFSNTMANPRSTKKKQNKPSQRNAGKGRNRPARTSVTGETVKLAKLIADPCTAPLVAPQYGASDGGYLAKLSSFHSQPVSTDATSGMILWFPDFCGRKSGSGAAGRNGNLFVFTGTSGSDAPVNTAALPLGSSTAASDQGAFINDPAFDFLNSDNVQDARCAAACMKMIYTGRNDALSGRIGYLSNVPRAALLVGDGSSPPTINSLFRYSNNSTRTPLDVCEQKFRPGETSEVYRVPQHEAQQGGIDYAYLQGTATVDATSIGAGVPTGCGTGIGFVWDGLNTDSSLAFDFLKAVEWRPEVNSGLVTPAPTQAQGGTNIVTRAISYLDRTVPGWERQVFHMAKSGAAAVAQLAYSGPANAVVRTAGGALALGM